MRLIVTRPIAQALAAVRELRALGVDAHALPLIGIEPLTGAAGRLADAGGGGATGTDAASTEPVHGEPVADDPAAALRRCWLSLAQWRLVMFVSANAVEHFFAAARGAAWPARTLAGSTGPGTSAALLAAGVPPQCLREPGPAAPRLDSEALWQRLREHDWRGARALIVRGEGGGRDWLADTLRAAGAQVDFVAAYRRCLPRLDEAQAVLLAAAESEPARHAWHFSSSEAVHNLPRLSPGGGWRTSQALATHPRIAEAARAIGFEKVQALAPGLPALVQAWLALRQAPAADRPEGGPSIQSRPL